jgi:two-component system, response regulator RegA
MNDPWRILVVEDDPVFAGALVNALRRRGYAAESAEDARVGLALAEVQVPDAAVLDLKLGDDSGLALIRPLKIINPAMQIVLLTGYASIATAVEAIKLGATHYLPKPADTDDILAALGRAAGDTAVALPDEPMSVDRLEWEHIQKVLAEHEGNISATARALKMHRRTLQRKLLKRPVRA